jgi:hypothetical protein
VGAVNAVAAVGAAGSTEWAPGGLCIGAPLLSSGRSQLLVSRQTSCLVNH